MRDLELQAQIAEGNTVLKKKKSELSILMDRVHLSHSCKTTIRRIASFSHQVQIGFQYLYDQPQQNERLKQPWSHLVSFNPRPLKW